MTYKKMTYKKAMRLFRYNPFGTWRKIRQRWVRFVPSRWA
jgi:hypothetical protein